MSTSGSVRSVGPPAWPVVALAAATAGSVVLAYAATTRPAVTFAAVGYGLGALLGVALLTVYRALRNARRGGSFRPNLGLDRTAVAMTVIGVGSGMYCAFLLATELAK